MIEIRKKLAFYELYCIAVVAMVVNHFSLAFMPDADWPKLISRSLAMVWLVPVGYNAGFPLTKRIWYCAFALIAADMLLGFAPFPLSFATTFILVRLCIQPVMEFALKSRAHFFFVNVVALALSVPADLVCDYGTQAFLLASAGWTLRNRDETTPVIDVRLHFALVTLAYLVLQQRIFHFNSAEVAFLVVSCALMAWLLFHLRGLLREDLRRRPTDTIAKMCHFIGHHTMEIYVVHLIIISMIMKYVFTYG